MSAFPSALTWSLALALSVVAAAGSALWAGIRLRMNGQSGWRPSMGERREQRVEQAPVALIQEDLRLERLARLDAEAEQRRAEYLAQVAGELASSLDWHETLRKVAELGVRGPATFCVIYLQNDDGSHLPSARAHTDPALRELLERLPSKLIPTGSENSPESAIQAAIRSGASMLFTESDLPVNELLGFDGGQGGEAVEFAMSSAMFVPLRARGRVLGTIGFFRGSGDRPAFDQSDLGLAEALARGAAFSIDNARLYHQAKQASQARKELLSVVAHDLRSPLGAISVSAEMLLESDMVEHARRFHVEIIQRASGRMSRLIQDLVDAAKIESGHLGLEPALHPVHSILDDACEIIVTRARAKQVALTWEIAPEAREVWADRYRVLQVLGNLLDNALKFTEPGGTVRVMVEGAREQVLFSVSDTGPGIADEDLTNIFDRFWRAPAARGGGAGLGLAISKGIVEGHGGEITVESRRGKGATFRFTLPTPVLLRRLPTGATVRTRAGRSTQEPAAPAAIQL